MSLLVPLKANGFLLCELGEEAMRLSEFPFDEILVKLKSERELNLEGRTWLQGVPLSIESAGTSSVGLLEGDEEQQLP